MSSAPCRSLKSNAFKGSSGLRSITVDEENALYDSRDNCNAIIEKRRNMLLTGCSNTVIPASVEEIVIWAFCKCKDLTEISIPSGVTVINMGAFENCTGLKSVEIPKSVVHIHDCSFGDCTNLSSVTVGGRPVIIDEEVFDHCLALRTLKLLSDDPNKIYLYDDTFDKDIISDCTLIVPPGTEDIYRMNPIFCQFKDVQADDGHQ